MAPFPTSVRGSTTAGGGGLLPMHSPSASLSNNSSAAMHAYPPAPSPRSGSPTTTAATQEGAGAGMGAGETPQQRLQRLDPRRLFGGIKAPNPQGGIIRGLGGITQESTETVRRCLEENHIHSHTFFNDKGFHNHCSHHLLAAYSLGAPPSLLQDILELHRETASKPMPTIAPIEINESNWTEYLGDERYYPNYLAFFHRIISAPPPSSSPYADKPTSVVPVVEQYLFGGEGQMLVRAVSGALHPLIHIGHGIEFGLDGHVAEGLAQCAVHDARVAALFPEEWPPQPPRSTSFASSITSAFSSLRFSSSSSSAGGPSGSSSHNGSNARNNAHTVGNTGLPYFHSMTIASPDRSFARTAANLPRGPGARRYPREGLSGFTILSRILHDDALAPGNANTLQDGSKLDAAVRNRASRIAQWCEEWRFSTEERVEWDDPQDAALSDGGASRRAAGRGVNGRVGENKGKGKSMAAPPWDEIVEKCEELVWMATVIYAAAARPGYKDVKLDFFTMHGLTSVLFLPSMLEVLSPHLRPYLLMSHFRLLVAYWVSRGRPELYISEGLMLASAFPSPPESAPAKHGRGSESAVRRALEKARAGEDAGRYEKTQPSLPTHGETSAADDDECVNPWMKVLQSAADHDDEHVTKVVRSLYWAATQFGASPKGMFTSSLPGTEDMDGTIFIRAAGLTLTSLGWAHEGDAGRPGSWDRSVLGFDSTWSEDELLPGAEWPPAVSVNKGKSRASSSSNLSSMPPMPELGGGGTRTRSGTIVANTHAQASSIPQPPLSVAIDYSGGSSAINGNGNGGGYVHARPPLTIDATAATSHYATTTHSRSHSRSASAFSTPTGSGSRSPAGSVYGGETPVSATSTSARQGWRKVGGETTEEEVERRELEEEDRELMG
ncbi:hypothetical protein JCM10908_001366 [Rhodotorula pacifica]|uniref:questin oxidase family protein n=1 Tax=Rhodotorula pacifica TaxID=1495444 RepID=UPI00317D8410